MIIFPAKVKLNLSELYTHPLIPSDEQRHLFCLNQLNQLCGALVAGDSWEN